MIGMTYCIKREARHRTLNKTLTVRCSDRKGLEDAFGDVQRGASRRPTTVSCDERPRHINTYDIWT